MCRNRDDQDGEQEGCDLGSANRVHESVDITEADRHLLNAAAQPTARVADEHVDQRSAVSEHRRRDESAEEPQHPGRHHQYARHRPPTPDPQSGRAQTASHEQIEQRRRHASVDQRGQGCPGQLGLREEAAGGTSREALPVGGRVPT